MTITEQTLIERATLNPDDWDFEFGAPSDLKLRFLIAQRAQALYAVADWLDSEYGWVAIKHISPPGVLLRQQLEAAGIERPS